MLNLNKKKKNHSFIQYWKFHISTCINEIHFCISVKGIVINTNKKNYNVDNYIVSFLKMLMAGTIKVYVDLHESIPLLQTI